jgi:hypothetical protein
MSVRGAEGAGASGSEAHPEERRAGGGQRVAFEALVAVGEGDRGGFEAESVDVSPDGMRLRTAFLPAEGEKVVCRFDGMGSEILVEGEVLWRREESKGGEFGVRFIGLDDAMANAVRTMCMTLADPGEEMPAEGAAGVPRGSRVRLHIEGLGSPMKARVRTSAGRELSVGSNLEFLKVGRALELEDVEQGEKREAIIDGVKVDVDPETNVPQLVVTLRFEKAGAGADKKRDRAEAMPPATRRASEAPSAKAGRKTESGGKPAARAEKAGPNAAVTMLTKAATAGQAAAGKVGPALAGVALRTKGAAQGAMSSVLDLVQKRRVERAEAAKAAVPRRTTAPPPGGALTSDGRRLVRDEGPMNHEGEEDELAPARSPRRAAVMGGAMGLLAVLAIFGAVRALRGTHSVAAAPAASQSALAALPATIEPATVTSGTPTANVPLFGATPLSTTEPAAGAAPAAPSGAPSADPAATNGDDDEPAPGDGEGKSLKEWGQGTVSHPIVLKIKMDGPVQRISGASGAMGFTISVPGRRSLSQAEGLARKDKRLASVNVVNTSHGAEISVQFKDGVPAYLAKAKGDRLEIAIGKEGHGKVAKKKKKH